MIARPNFFIVGAPKCGTTALSEYLRSHPRVFMCSPKEPHYFASDFYGTWSEIATSEEDYLGLFRKATPRHGVIGEASASYVVSTVALERIRDFDNRASIVLMVRNPLDMVESLHSQLVFSGDEDIASLRRAWGLQDSRRSGSNVPDRCRVPAWLQYREMCSFAPKIRRCSRLFRSAQLKIIVFDDLVADSRKVYEGTLAFLGLPSDGRERFPRFNPRKRVRLRRLADFDQRPPKMIRDAVFRIKSLLGVERHSLLRHLYGVKQRRRALDARLRSELEETFQDDVLETSELLGRDLSHWLSVPTGHRQI